MEVVVQMVRLSGKPHFSTDNKLVSIEALTLNSSGSTVDFTGQTEALTLTGGGDS